MSSNDGSSVNFDEKVYSNMIDESTKILITSQQRHVAMPDPKKQKAGGLDESNMEEKSAKRGPMRVTAILRSIPTVFQNMSKKTEGDTNQMKIIRKQ